MRDDRGGAGRVSALAAAPSRPVDEPAADLACDAIVRDANVIAFPRVKPSPKRAEMDPLAWVIVGLRRVGEPATSAEISEAIANLPVALKTFDRQAVEAVLTGDARRENPLGLFQQVRLRGSAAWGFTSTFRLVLWRAGFHPIWRSE